METPDRADVTDAATDSVVPRAALEAARAAFREEIAATIEAPGPMTYGSQAAAASHVFEQQRDLALRDRAIAQLALVEGALIRLDDGSYGRCLRCGGPIAGGRLEALPWAELCIACARIVGPGGTG
ncbi:MAG: TraR/DksA family transcriptional regulator [Candidatus Limnocylindrales bacterium]